MSVREGADAARVPSAAQTALPENKIPAEVWRTVIVVIIGAVMSFLDATIVNVALKSLSRGLGMSLDTGQWTITAYLLALAAAIPVTTWAARRVGVRRLYIASLLLFTIASTLCGLAVSPWQLIAFRAIQGIGGGMVGPTSQVLLVTAAGPRRLARVMAAFGVPVMLAPVMGPPMGGLLVQYAGWRWIFLVNLPVGILGAILAMRLLQPDKATSSGHHLDVIGLALVSPGMVALTYGLAEAGDTGQIGSRRVLTTLLAGVLLLTGFAVRSLRVRKPLLELRLYRNVIFGSASLSTLLMGGVIFGGMILMPLYYQIVRHQGTMSTGLLVAPQGIGVALAIWMSGRAYDRFGTTTVLFGSVLTVVATVPFALIGATTSYWLLGGTMVVRGIGIGLASVPVTTAAFHALEPAQAGEASTQLNMLQRLGGSIGTAVLVVILHRRLAIVSTPAAQASAFGIAYWAVLASTVVMLMPAMTMRRAARRTHDR